MAALRLTAEALAARRGDRTVFEDVSFSIGPGDVLAVTGPNGAGKSTLLRIVAGLLAPARGSIVLDPAPDAGRGVAVHYLGHLEALKPAFTIAENLAFWRRLYGGAGDLDEALEDVGLGGLAHLPVGRLSAGQKRRVAIARLLVIDRPIWLLDEPTTALDAAAEATLGRLIERHRTCGGLVLAAIHRPLPVDPTATIVLGKAAA
ncbi:heme ABC exporter ATP-binding protein CcmA [Bauldia litoralis]|uniref:Heme exporter protein A n=1 Tax=Bauldia litoralis TaxID=665467 RepID=A0A1G6ADG8_9HYPH|nr:heme exporter protein A [Bauldia litoralis]